MTGVHWLPWCAAVAAAATLLAGFFGGPEYSVAAAVTALAWIGALLYLLAGEAP